MHDRTGQFLRNSLLEGSHRYMTRCLPLCSWIQVYSRVKLKHVMKRDHMVGYGLDFLPDLA